MKTAAFMQETQTHESGNMRRSTDYDWIQGLRLHELVAGDRVLARWQHSAAGREWFPGRIADVNTQGSTCTYSIRYDDGDWEEHVDRRNIKGKESREDSPAEFKRQEEPGRAKSTPQKRKAALSPGDVARTKRGKAQRGMSPHAGGTTNWSVLRCAAKDKATRSGQGDNRSPMLKTACDTVELRKEGVVGKARVFFGLFGSKTIADFNGYRQRGDANKGFAPGTPDRAVLLVCDSVYSALRAALPGVTIEDGSIGENLLVSGPSFEAGKDLAVGTRLRIGDTATLEITEANNPCYRLRRMNGDAGGGVDDMN